MLRSDSGPTPARRCAVAGGRMTTVFEALGDVDHRVVASLDLGSSGFQLECSCGWLSPRCASALDLFDEWAHHVKAM